MQVKLELLFTQYWVLLKAVPAYSESQSTVKAVIIQEDLLIQRHYSVCFRSYCNLIYYSWPLP